jgi:hypothetical protein
MRNKAKINKQNTRHGKMDMPFASLNKYAGMAKGGDVKKEMKAAGIFAKAGEKKLAAHERREAMGKEKDTPAMAKKEMSVLKKAKAPKDVMDYEKKEHKAMGFARGGGIESKGKTRGKFFAEGGDVEDDTDAEGYGTKITRSPRTFAEAFKEARAKGKGTEFTWNGKKIAAYRAGEEPESWKKSAKKTSADLEEVAVSAKKLPVESKPAAKPVESKPAAKPVESKPAAKPVESKPAAKPNEVAMAPARVRDNFLSTYARRGYPDYSNKDVRKGAVEGVLKGAELAALAAGVGASARAGLGAVRAGMARFGRAGMARAEQEAASRAGVQAFKKDVAETRAQESRKDIMEGMDKLRPKRDAVKADEDMGWFAKGGSIKKYARGGGIESKGKTRGKFI